MRHCFRLALGIIESSVTWKVNHRWIQRINFESNIKNQDDLLRVLLMTFEVIHNRSSPMNIWSQIFIYRSDTKMGSYLLGPLWIDQFVRRSGLGPCMY